jgi:hypothetical protein
MSEIIINTRGLIQRVRHTFKGCLKFLHRPAKQILNYNKEDKSKDKNGYNIINPEILWWGTGV